LDLVGKRKNPGEGGGEAGGLEGGDAVSSDFAVKKRWNKGKKGGTLGRGGGHL